MIQNYMYDFCDLTEAKSDLTLNDTIVKPRGT